MTIEQGGDRSSPYLYIYLYFFATSLIYNLSIYTNIVINIIKQINTVKRDSGSSL